MLDFEVGYERASGSDALENLRREMQRKNIFPIEVSSLPQH